VLPQPEIQLSAGDAQPPRSLRSVSVDFAQNSRNRLAAVWVQSKESPQLPYRLRFNVATQDEDAEFPRAAVSILKAMDQATRFHILTRLSWTASRSPAQPSDALQTNAKCDSLN
jgi:hypothetical protein